ncbi:MAG: ABC transporter ATP-binding protein [Hyphomicrobiales bacterium]
MSPRLVIDRLGVARGGARLIDDISLDIDGGAFIALVGPNGAGKTTLLRAIAALCAHEGTVRLDDVEVATMAPRARARAFSYLEQGGGSHWPVTAREIVALGRMPHASGSVLSAADEAAIAAALAAADVAGFAGRRIDTLSGGERARVLLARALAVEAPVLLVDEPTAALDPRHQLAVFDILRTEAESGRIVIAAVHDLVLADRYADRIAIIDRGRLDCFCAPEEALTDARLARVFGLRRDGEGRLGPRWSPA